MAEHIQKYVPPQDIARFLAKKGKVLSFCTDDLRPLHRKPKQRRSLIWAREQIKRMLKNGIITSFKVGEKQEWDTRRVRYRFVPLALRTWGL